VGLAQNFIFEYDEKELEELLLKIGFTKVSNGFQILDDKTDFFVAIVKDGLHVHRSGEYFY
jgi:hypothetical protein